MRGGNTLDRKTADRTFERQHLGLCWEESLGQALKIEEIYIYPLTFLVSMGGQSKTDKDWHQRD